MLPADATSLESCRFIYTSYYDPYRRILSDIHGDFARNRSFVSYELYPDERIIQIQIQTVNPTILSDGKQRNYSRISISYHKKSNSPMDESVNRKYLHRRI